jgi:hypothetical protein
MSFTEEDYKIMDIIIFYKPIYDELVVQSLMYKFNMNKEIYDTLKVEVENLDTKKIFTSSILPLGYLTGNKFCWGIDAEFQEILKKRVYLTLDKMKISQKILNTLDKLFNNHSFELDYKYRQIIPVLFSLLFDNSEVNYIRFASDTTTEDFFYYCITVPLKLEKEYKIQKEEILILLKDFANNKMKRSIPIKKTSKKNSKKTNKRESVHKISRSVNKLFFK